MGHKRIGNYDNARYKVTHKIRFRLLPLRQIMTVRTTYSYRSFFFALSDYILQFGSLRNFTLQRFLWHTLSPANVVKVRTFSVRTFL